MANPQDPKDPPHSQNGGGSGFIPYVPAWGRLIDAIKPLMAGGRPKDQAKIDLCRAIAEGRVKIWAKLERRTITNFRASDTALEGTAFQIPPVLKPADLDWEGSRPLNPWLVRHGAYKLPGHWHLEWIEVCIADVASVFRSVEKRDESATQHASSETPATSTRPAPESRQIPVGPDPRSTAGLRKPGAAGPARRRGARPLKFERARDAMRNDVQQGRLTLVGLENMLEKHLSTSYGVSRDTARNARNAVLSELNSRQIPTNDK